MHRFQKIGTVSISLTQTMDDRWLVRCTEDGDPKDQVQVFCSYWSAKAYFEQTVRYARDYWELGAKRD
jgi:hypothetical protein